jgi:hypothetical protein
LDFGRCGVVGGTAKFEPQVLEITAGNWVFQEFFNDGLEVSQGTDSRQRRHVGGPDGATEAGQQESGLKHFQGNAAVKPEASLALVWNAGAQRRVSRST